MFKIDIANTSVGKTIPLEKIKAKLKEYLIVNGNNTLFEHIKMPLKTVFISGILSADKDIPMFVNPIIVENTKGEKIIFVDIRGYLKSKVTEEEIRNNNISEVLKNQGEYSLAVVRVYLMENYLEKDFLAINNIRDDLANAFALWISTVIANSYFLTPEETIALKVVLIYYYLALMSPNDITMANIKRTLVAINKSFGTAIDDTYIERIIEPLTKEFDYMNPKSINDLVKIIHLALERTTDKLKNMNSISLNQMLLNSWYGENSNELINISVEHPPTFAGLCYLALNNNSFKVTKLSSILNSKLKNKKDLGVNLNNILRDTNYR